jgi:hypothetical protein
LRLLLCPVLGISPLLLLLWVVFGGKSQLLLLSCCALHG